MPKNVKDTEAYLLIKKKKRMKKNFFYLSVDGNLKKAAKNLYSTLRENKKK